MTDEEPKILDVRRWAERLRRLDFYHVAVVIVTPLVWLLFVALRRRRSFFRRVIHNCNAACFIECWTLGSKRMAPTILRRGHRDHKTRVHPPRPPIKACY